MREMKKVSILALHLGYGGIEKAVATLANTLCTSYEVEIACIYQLQEEPAFQIDPKVKITYLIKEKPNREAWLSALKQVKPITFIKESFYSVKTLYYRKKKMPSYIKQSDSDIIIATRDFLDRSLGKYGKATCFKVGWEHNHHHGNQRYEKKIVKSNQKLDALVLVSQDLKKDYQAKLKTCRCVYIPNSIDDYPEIPSDLTQHHLISVGRLSKEKGFFDLIQIFEKIVSSHPDWKLDIIGDGREREHLKSYVKEHHLEDFIIFHGFQGKAYINQKLLSSSVYLMTSYTESFGIVLIEAMSYGLPTIAFDSAEGAREIVKDGKNGFLISDRDQEKYIQKVEQLMDSQTLRQKLGTNGRKDVKKFTKEEVGKIWFDFLERGK